MQKKIISKRKINEFEAVYTVKISSEAGSYLAFFLVSEGSGIAPAQKPKLLGIKEIGVKEISQSGIPSPYADAILLSGITAAKGIVLPKKEFEYLNEKIIARDYSFLSVHRTRAPSARN